MAKKAFIVFLLIPLMSLSQTPKDSTRLKEMATFGFLQGGGSLLGFDYEHLLSKRVGIQVGAGILAFGGSLNFHIKPKINSSSINLIYWHQGIGKHHYTQGIMGLAYSFKAWGWFSSQVGLGHAAQYGPVRPKVKTEVIPLYSVGFYYPF